MKTIIKSSGREVQTMECFDGTFYVISGTPQKLTYFTESGECHLANSVSGPFQNDDKRFLRK